MTFSTRYKQHKIKRTLSKVIITLTFLFVLIPSQANDLQHDELDVSIGEVSLSEYIRLVTQAQHLSTKSDVSITQQGSDNQIQINLYSSSNNIEIYQHGESNISDLSINGSENSIYLLQVGKGNYVELRQAGDSSITVIEQVGDYNQVIMDVQGNSQINRIYQYGNDMKAIIRN